MRILRLILILIFSICLLGCAFEENREVEKKLTNSVNNFHSLFNQGKFVQIYLEADDNLRNKLTEQQFVSYLEIIKNNDVGKLKDISHVWLKDEFKDGIKRILLKKTKFSHIELMSTDKANYREKFEWNLRNKEAKLASYELEKICDKPCRLVIDTK